MRLRALGRSASCTRWGNGPSVRGVLAINIPLDVLVTGQYRRCVHIGRAAACALALGCVSGAPFAQSDESQIEKVVFDAGALFDFDAYQLRPEGRAALDDFVGRLKGTSLGMIRAVGHADRLGSEGYNQILSEDRAEAVKAYLVSKGIEPDRVRAEGRGTRQPVTKPGECADGKNAKVIACLQSDRRVGIEVAGTRALTNWQGRPKEMAQPK